MTEKTLRSESSGRRVLAALCELIGALDRRVRQVDREGERLIASDAQVLRRAAVTRLEELKRGGSDDNAYDPQLVEAIMTDDGGPTVATPAS